MLKVKFAFFSSALWYLSFIQIFKSVPQKYYAKEKKRAVTPKMLQLKLGSSMLITTRHLSQELTRNHNSVRNSGLKTSFVRKRWQKFLTHTQTCMQKSTGSMTLNDTKPKIATRLTERSQDPVSYFADFIVYISIHKICRTHM